MEINVIKTKIGQLRDAERNVKSLLGELVPVVTARIHDHQDVDSANLLVLALTPINQKKVLSFFKQFSGHHIKEDVVTKRIKPFNKGDETIDGYQVAKDAWDTFVESGMNFWQWAVLKAERPESTEIDMDKLRKQVDSVTKKVKKALDAGAIDTTTAIQMLTSGLMTQDDLMKGLSAMFKAEAAVSQVAHAATLVKPATAGA